MALLFTQWVLTVGPDKGKVRISLSQLGMVSRSIKDESRVGSVRFKGRGKDAVLDL